MAESLPQYTSGADRWMFDHAMDCISWLANEITEHRDHIDDEDLWYETGNAANQCIIENESGLRFFDVEAVARVTMDDLKASMNNRSEMVQSTNAIHDSFNVEVRRQRSSHAQHLSWTKWNNRLSWNNRSAR